MTDRASCLTPRGRTRAAPAVHGSRRRLPHGRGSDLPRGLTRMLLAMVVAVAPCGTRVASADDAIARAERSRMELIAEVSPSVVCIYDEMERGGGSGALIDEEGNGLTNFHVVAGMVEKRRGLGGLSDGNVYELEVLGVDPGGDVAMFRLLGRDRFPHAKLGDSDAVRLGDEVLAMGNPFVISEDHTPTVTSGIVTGLHRYQGGMGQNLVYSDCIQIDASINPGNSGGPLFNRAGEVIGINGRISVNTRGRFNVGFGYAITANQIRRFVPTLRAGLLARHGTMQATVDQVSSGEVRVGSVRPGFAADRAGIKVNDRLVSIDGRRMETVNDFAGTMGTYPANWPIRVRLESSPNDILVRLDPSEPKLHRPFVPDPEVNRRAVERAIRRYREWPRFSIQPRADAAAPRPRVKHVPRDAEGKESPTHRFSNLWDAQGQAEVWEGSTGGERRNRVSISDRVVRARNADSLEEFTPLMEDALTFASLFVIERLLPEDPLFASREDVRHAGAGGVMPTSGDASVGVAELITVPILEASQLELALDVDDGRLLRATARDPASGVVVELTIEAERLVAGFRRPSLLTVRGPTRNRTESLEPIETVP